MRLIVTNPNGHEAHRVDTRPLPLLPPAHGGRPAHAPGPKLSAAELEAIGQRRRADNTLGRLTAALAEAADARDMNRALADLVDELEDKLAHATRRQRAYTAALIAVAAVAGYVAGLLHAGALP